MSAGFAVSIALVLVAGCGASGETGAQNNGSTSPYLQSVGPPAIGLHYREVGDLQVKLLGPSAMPIVGATVTFMPLGDSGGTALAGDTATTDQSGLATISVAAGVEEATFRVVASSLGAVDLSLDVTVSRYPFADVSVALSYGGVGAAQVATLSALIYADRDCAHLPLLAVDPTPYRDGSVAGVAGVVDFPSLPEASYAVVGRAESTAGRLIARGCVDVLASQLAGGTVQIPVPLAAAVPALAAAYQLGTDLRFAFASESPVAAWDLFASCPLGVAQSLLDSIALQLGGALADHIADHRGDVDGSGCRPALNHGNATLDALLATALTAPGAPATLLPAVSADLDAVVANALVTSRLSLTAADGATGSWLASHTLAQVTLSGAGGAHAVSYDPIALGLPVPSVDGVPVTFDGQTVTIAEHGLTLRLPVLWGLALADVALAPRSLPTNIPALLDSVVTAAALSANGVALTGCVAIEELLCDEAEIVGQCALQSACAAGAAALAATLSAPFAPTAGLDLHLTGTATGIDTDGDLVADSLQAGSFIAQVAIAPARTVTVIASFSGTQIPTD